MSTRVSRIFWALVTTKVAALTASSLLCAAVGYWLATGNFFLLAAVGGLGLIAVTVVSPHLGLVLWLIITPFVQFFGDPFSPYRWFRITLHWLGLPAIALFFWARDKRLKLEQYEGFYLLFWIFMGASFFITWGNPAANEPGWRTLLFNWGLPFFALLAASRLVTQEQSLPKSLILGLILMSLVVSSSAVIEYLSPVRFFGSLSGLWQDIPGGRAVGPLSNPVPTNYIAQVGAVFALYWAMRERTLLSASLTVACGLLTAAATFLGFTRSTWISFLAAILLTVWPYPRWRRWGVAALATLVGAFFLNIDAWLSPEVAQARVYDLNNIFGRLAQYYVALQMFLDSPLGGQGFNTYDVLHGDFAVPVLDLPAEIVAAWTSHNTFLTILAELGFIGFSLFALTLWFALKPGIALIVSKGQSRLPQRPALFALLGAIVAYLVNAMAIDMRYFSYAQCLFFLNIGLFSALAARTKGATR